MARRSGSTRKHRNGSGSFSPRWLAVERLEERRLLAITVDTHLDVVDLNDGFTSLREAIFAANTLSGADTIDFAPALTADGSVTILLTQGELAITEALTIDGPGATLLTIDAQEQSRIFNVTATTGDFSIGGMKLTNGWAAGFSEVGDGGALRVRTTGDTFLTDVLVTMNQATGSSAKGGGVSTRGDLTIIDCQFFGNRTLQNQSHGGAIYTGGQLTISGSDISDNVSEGESVGGSAVYAVGSISFEQSTILRNRSLGFGSAISSLETVELLGSEVSENEGGVTVYAAKGASLVDTKVLNNQGGGVTTDFMSSRTITLLRSVMSGNTKGGPVGGAGLYTRGSVELQASEVTHNRTTEQGGHGGGIVARYGGLTAIDSVIAHNSTAGMNAYGGGVFTRGLATLINTRIEGNSTSGGGSHGGGIYADQLVATDNCVISNNRTTGFVAEGGAVFARVVTLEDTILQGNYTTGFSANGGAVRTSQLSAVRSFFTSNSTFGDQASGGGAYAFQSTPGAIIEIVDSTFDGNSTHGGGSHGGAMYGRTITLIIEGTSVVNNGTMGHSSKGGGLRIEGTNATINNSAISHNSTVGDNADGGGIYSVVQLLNVSSTTISGNNTSGNDADGGGLRGSVRFQNSSILGNYTLGDRSRGGGVFFLASIGLTESTVSGNTTSGSQSHGGGVFGGVTAVRSTVSNNRVDHSTSYGGGVYGFSQLQGSIVAGNSAGGGASDIKGNLALQHVAFSLIGDMTGTNIAEAPLGSPDANGNLIGGPVHGVIDPLLGPLADNGGPTWTHALLVGSPALDAGDPAAVAGMDGVPKFDQRGELFGRVADGDGAGGARIDIGAFERQPGETFQLVVDTLADEDDGDYSAGDFSLREAIAIANANPGSDTISFSSALTVGGPATILLTQSEIEVTDALTIDGPGAALLTIDAQQQSRIFNITATTGGFDIRDLSLTGGQTTGNNSTFDRTTYCGGAIRSVSEGFLLLEGLNLYGNSTTGFFARGGAVFSLHDLTINRSNISANWTNGNQAYGGGLSAGGEFIINECDVSDNLTYGEGAVGAGIEGFGNVTLQKSVVTRNIPLGSPTTVGGVIAVGDLTVVDSVVSNNGARGLSAGGSPTVPEAEISVTRSTISGNSGVGISGERVVVVDSTISTNGGGINASGSISVLRSTVTGNHASGARAGGLYSSSSTGAPATISISHSIVAGNSAGEHSPDLDARSNQFVVNYSLIGDKSGTNLVEAPVGSPDANGNLIGGPISGVIDPLLGPLVNNGGPTLPDGSRILTHALLPGSPSLNAGDPAAVAGVNGVSEFDQRGAPWSRVVGGRIDMGAVEAQANPLPGDYDFNGVVDAADYSVWRDTVGSTNDLRADGSGAVVGEPDEVVDAHDYAFWKMNYGSMLEQGAGSGEQGGASIASVSVGQPPALPGVNAGAAALSDMVSNVEADRDEWIGALALNERALVRPPAEPAEPGGG